MNDTIEKHLAAMIRAPGDDRPFRELENLFTGASRWNELVELYENRVRVLPDSPAAPQILSRAGDVLRTRVRNLPRAEELYRRVLATDPKDANALDGLKEIYEAKGDLAQLTWVLEQRAATQEGEDAAQSYFELGLVFEKMGRRDRAVLAFQRSSKADESTREPLDRAFANLLAMGRFQTALDHLDRVQGKFGTDGLAPQYAAIAEKLQDAPLDHALGRRAAETALKLDPQNPAAAKAWAIIDSYPQTWRDRVKALRIEANDERDRKRMAQLYLAIAMAHAVYDAEADGRKKVKEFLDRAMILWPGMPEAIDFLERFAGLREDWKSLELVLDKLGAEIKERTAAVDVLVRLAMVRTVRFANREGTLAALLKATELDPSRADAVGLAFDLLLDDKRFADAAALLEKHLGTMTDARGQVALRMRLGELFETRLENPSQAKLHYEAVLRLEPGSIEAAKRLAPLYEATGEGQKLAETLEVLLPSLRTLGEKVDALERVAELYGDKSGRPKDAQRVLTRALLLDPERAKVRKALEKYAAATESWDEVVAAYRTASEVGGAGTSRPALMRRVAELLDSPMNRLPEALEAWKKLRELDPSDASAAQAVESLLARLGSHDELAARYQQQLSKATDPKERFALLDKMAKTLEQGGGNPSQAAELYRQMLELQPGSAEVIKRLINAAAALEKWDEVADLNGKLAALAEGDEAKVHLMRRAQVIAERLPNKEVAAEIYLKLLAEDPKRPGLVSALEKLAALGVFSKRIAEVLAPLYAASGDFVRVASALQTQLAGTDDVTQRVALMGQLAKVHEERLADRRAAFGWVEKSFRLAPQVKGVRDELERLAKSLSAQAEIAGIYMDVADTLSERGRAIDLLLAAGAHAEAAREVDLALHALSKLLNKQPGSVEALTAIHRIVVKAERWVDAERALRLRIAAEPSKSAELLVELSQVCERLGRHADAAHALEDAIAGGASEVELLPKLSALYEAAKDLKGLRQSLTWEMELAEKAGDRDRAARLRLRLSRLLEGSLGDRAAAVQNYAAILQTRPSDPEALSALEKLLQDAELRESAARALVPAYEQAKEFRKLVYALEVISESTESPADKAVILRRAAQIHSVDLRQPDLAFATLARAFRYAPLDPQLRVATRKAAEESDALDAYAEVVNEAAEAAEGAAAIPLLRELAEISERKLSDRERAVACYQRVLSLDAQNLDALRGLHRLYRQTEDYENLAEICQQLAKVVYDDAEKVSLWREAATLLEGALDRPEHAANCFRALAEVDPLDRDAAVALDRLYEKAKKPQDLAFALELRRAQEGGSPAGREIAFRLAELKRNVLGDTAGALQIFQALLTEDPSHAGGRAALETWARAGGPGSAEAMKLIDPVLEKAGEHARRVGLREAQLNGAGADERARLLGEICRVYEVDMGQPEMAFMAACRAFREGVERDRFEAEIERLARATNSIEELADVYEGAAGAALSGDELVPRATRRAAQLRQQLGETERAVSLWNELLAEQPGDREALDALAKLHEKSQNARELADVYRQKAQHTQDPQERAQLLLQSGLAKLQLGETEEAIALGRAVLAIAPKHKGALELLDRAYQAVKRPREHADVLKLLAEVSEEGPGRRGTLMRRAMLLEKDGDAAEAVDAYAAVLADSPGESSAVSGLERIFGREQGRVEAAKVLEAHYRAVNDARHLAEVLEARAAQAPADERLALFQEIARLRESLGQRPLAFAAVLRCFREEPANAAIRQELERLAAETGAFEELAAAYEDELDRGCPDDLALELWRRLGSIYGDRLGRPDRSAQALEEVFRRAPQDGAVLDALARIYRRSNDLKALAFTLQRQVQLEASPERRRELHVEVATLSEEKLADLEGAIAGWREVLKADDDDDLAHEALNRLYAEAGHFEDLAGLVESEIGLAERKGKTEEGFELKVKLGRLKLTKLADPRGALNAFTEVLAARPGHPGAVAALEEMSVGEGPLKADAALALEPVFAQGSDHLKLVQVLEARSQAAAPAEKAALLRRVADTYAGPLASPEMAFVYAARALEASPDDEPSLAACLKFVDEAGTHEELAALITEVAEKAHGDESRVRLHRTLGRLSMRPLNEPDQAVVSWKRVLELAPADTEALDRLSDIYRESEQWDDLLEVLRKQLLVADAERRVLLLNRIGEIQDERTQEYAAAIATFRRVLELKPDDHAALERLDKLCTRSERWAELADVLLREVQLAATEGRREQEITLKFRLAQVREQRLLDRAGAMALYREILTARPGHEETVSRLEAIVSREPTYDEAAEILAAAYRAVSNHGKLATLLDERSAAVTDSSQRKQYLSELARIRGQHQERPELAFLALCKAFREDPTDPELRKTLEKVAEQADGLEELAALYEEELSRLDGADAGDVCFKLAQINEQKLSDVDAAIRYYEKARAFDANRARQALPALDRLYKQEERWNELLEVLGAQLALAEEKGDRTALLFRMGQLAEEKLDPPSPDRAARAYEQILEIDGTHMPAARALEKLYETAKKYDELSRILQLQREHATGPERERITARLAEVSGHGLGDIDGAITLYREMLEKNPRSDAAYLALEGLFEDAGRDEELSQLLRKRLSITVDPREITRLSDKLGRVLAALGRTDEAVAAFRGALERDPRHKKSLEALRDLYEKQQPSDELATVLRRLIPLQDEPSQVKKVRLRLAEVLGTLGRREEAIESARRGLDLEPHAVEDLVRAEELFRNLSAFNDQIKAMEIRATVHAAAGQTEEAVTVLFAAAEVWSLSLKKREASAPSYEKILELQASNRLAFDALREIYSAQNDWRKYAATFERFLPSVTNKNEKVDLLKDLGAVQEQKLAQKDLAFLSLSRAFTEAPEDDEVRESVHRLADETGSFEELVSIYETFIDDVPKGPVAERLLLGLAKVQDEKLDEPDAAEASLRKVLEFDPANARALEALASMFARRGRDQDYVVSLEQKYEAAPTIEEKKGILLEIARVHDAQLKNVGEAVGAYLRALALEPDRQTFRTLADLHRRDARWTDVAETLIRARDYEGEPEVRARLQVEVAEVYERELNDDEAAIAGYKLALEFDPKNREALAALERLYTKLDRPAELLGVYDEQLKLAEPRDRVKILFKSAGIWEGKYQHLENADACLEAILAIEPTNLQAIKGLERIRREDAEAKRPNAARWEDLIRAYERHLSLSPALDEQVDLLVQAGEVYYRELKKTDRAAQIFHKALELQPRSRQAMHALGLLYERSGNWPFALDMLNREAEVLGASSEAVELFHRIGKINEDMLLDTGSAKEAYRKALTIDPAYLPSIKALKGLFESEKSWDDYLEMLKQEAEHTQDLGERTKAWLAVARFHQDSREDRDGAARYFEEALKLTPDSLEAARPLADIYVAVENYERAEQMLDIVAEKLGAQVTQDPSLARELGRQLYRLGYVCERLKKGDRALKAYEFSYKLDATYLPAAEGYGNLLVAAGRHADALSVYQAILIHHREDLTDLEVVELYWQMGELYRKNGQPDRAQKELEKALGIDSNHEPSLRSLVELLEETKAHEAALEYRHRLVELLDGDARFDMLVGIARTARDALQDSYQAIDSFGAALKIRGDSEEVLEELLALYRETKQGARAVDTLERLLALPSVSAEPAKAKKMWFGLGETYRDEVKDNAKAAECFNKALDLDFKFVQAFSALEALLGSTRQWDALEQNYMRMIQRLPKTDDTHVVRMALFKALAELYEKVKKDKRAAKQVYQVVVKGLPDDVDALEKYADLASEDEGSEAEAMDAFRRALPVTANPQKVVSQLARLSAKTKDYDGAWVSAQVSAHLVGEPGADEREILTKLAPYAKKREQATRPMTNIMWTGLVFHPKVRGPMGEILALVQERLGVHYAKRHQNLLVDPKLHRIDLANALEFQLSAFRQAMTTLDLEGLELYSPFLVHARERAKAKANPQAPATPAPDRELFLELLHTSPLALKAGGKLFSEQDGKALQFQLGKALAWARPELALAKLLPAEKLEAVFQAAVVLGMPSFRVTADPRAVEVERRVLERLEPQFRPALTRLARQYVATANQGDVRNFIEGAELTSNRMGTLLCTDVEVAKNAITSDSGGPGRVPLRARIRDLLLFCMSREYVELRENLGLKIEIKLPGKTAAK